MFFSLRNHQLFIRLVHTAIATPITSPNRVAPRDLFGSISHAQDYDAHTAELWIELNKDYCD